MPYKLGWDWESYTEKYQHVACQDYCSLWKINLSFCWWKKSCTSWGKGNLSQYLQGFIHPRWLAGFLPSTVPSFLTPSRLLPSSIEFSCFIFSQSVFFCCSHFLISLGILLGFSNQKKTGYFFGDFYRFGFWVDDVPNFPFGGGICDRFLEGTYSILSEFLKKSKVNKLYLEPHLTHHFFWVVSFREGTWRIIPVSKWLITMVSFHPLSRVVGPLPNGRYSWLLNGGY